MPIDNEPLYIPVKLQQVRGQLAERIQNRKLSKMILKPQKKGLITTLISLIKRD